MKRTSEGFFAATWTTITAPEHISASAKMHPTEQVQLINDGAIVEFSELGGLHHRYERHAA
jgi:hypothetical protein